MKDVHRLAIKFETKFKKFFQIVRGDPIKNSFNCSDGVFDSLFDAKFYCESLNEGCSGVSFDGEKVNFILDTS